VRGYNNVDNSRFTVALSECYIFDSGDATECDRTAL